MLLLDTGVALRRGASALGCSISDTQVDKLLAYLALLTKWNQVYNLTAIRSPGDMLSQHLLDSMTLVAPLMRFCCDSSSILDVGSGGGLPGVVIAVLQPRWTVTCVDAVAKKASFVRQVASELRLPNLVAEHQRVEQRTSASDDIIISRAFAALPDFVNWTRGCMAPAGVWLAMKGKLPVDEIAALPSDVEVFHVEQVTVPGLSAERCLVWMRPKSIEAR